MALPPVAIRAVVPEVEGQVAVRAARERQQAHLLGDLCQRRPRLGEPGPLSQGVQARRKALRIRHINGMEMRKKMPRGFK